MSGAPVVDGDLGARPPITAASEASSAAPTEPVAAPPPRMGASLRSWCLLLVACVSLLGQGERVNFDRRFLTPGSTLQTYWRAIRSNDMETVTECFTEPDASLPFPGMLWFLPPVDSLEIDGVRVVSAESGHIVTAYEVRFLPSGMTVEQSFIATSELRRLGHEWRIVPPSGEAGMPDWTPYPRPVDI